MSELILYLAVMTLWYDIYAYWMDIMVTRNFALCNSFEQIGDNNSGIQIFHNFSEQNIALISRSLFFASAKYREGATSPLVIFV